MKLQALPVEVFKSHRAAYAVGCLLVVLALFALMNAPANLAVNLLHERVLGVHIVLELIAIVIAFMIATASWHMAQLRRESTASVMLFGFMVVACCDLMHMMTFKGMPAFITQSDPERGLFFWLTGRSVEVLTLLYLTIGRAPSVPRGFALIVGMAVSFLVVWMGSFHIDLFPRTFIEGVGLTPFKVNFEYALCALNLVTALLLARRAAKTGSNQFRLLAMSSFVMGVGELSFTSYLGMSDFQTHAGHLYKVVAYVLLYRSTYVVNVLAPIQALRSVEHDLRTVLDALPSMVGYCDHNLINRIANKAFADWFGMEGTSMPGRHVRELMGEDLFRKSVPYMEAALRGEPQAFERSIPRPDGQGSRHAFTHYLPDWQADKVVGFYFMVHDVSALNEAQHAQREALAELTAERQRIDNILRGAEVGTWDCDLGTGELRIDERWAGILGYTTTELRPHMAIRTELAHPAELAFTRTRLREHLKGHTSMFDEECRFRHRDGHWVWVLDRGRVSARDANGRALRMQGTLLDISSAKLAQARLAEREAFLERVGEVAEVGGWQFDVGTGAITLSRETCRISGVAEDFQPTLEESLAFYSEASRPLVRQAVRDAIKHDKPFDWELPYRNAQGHPLWVRVVGEAVFDDDSPGALPTRVIGALQNITERNRAAQALQRANERLALAVDSAGMGVWEYNLHASTLTWDGQMYKLYGRTRSGEAEPYTLWRDNIHPDDRESAEKALVDAIEGKRAFNTQFRIHRADGTLRHLKAAAIVVHDTSGKPLRMIGVNMDVTDQVETAAALLENQQLLHRVGSLASIGGWRVDIKSGTVYWSEQTRRIHEVPPDYVPSIAAGISFYAPEHRELISQAVQQGIDSGRSWDLELRFITHTGRSIWVRALGEVEFEQGRARHLVGALQDITELREAADMLRAASAAAESASTAKSAFLANMSHEIRTPLNAVIGVTHLLADSGLNDDQRQLVAQAQIAGRSLLGIVNDVLDLSKIEAGEMELEEVVFRPAELLTELEAVYGAQALSKGLSFSVHGVSDVPTWLLGDSTRLRQILTNLISNALKFTHEGGVTVRLSVASQENSRVVLRASVRDTGIGIEPEVQGRLFQPFAQADVSTNRHYGGTGLGLSIVRRLSQLMGGEVELNSSPGQGSEFRLDVPMTLPRPDQTAALAGGMLDVLVVDGNLDDRLALATMTRSLGWRTTLLGSAAELMRHLQLLVKAGEPLPAAMILDWQMPDMDGLQTLRMLSEQFDRDRLPAVLMIAAQEPKSIADLDQDQLTDQILTKPVGASALFNAVTTGIARRGGRNAAVALSMRPGVESERWLSDVQVLVVDDSDINLDIARRLLERQGAKVQICSGGREALSLLGEKHASFDLVLMDVQMPHMDGLETTRRIRNDLGLRELPIVALTAGALTEERKRAMASGMDDFLSKPLDPQDMVRSIKRLVESRRGHTLAVAPARPTAESHPVWPVLAGIDTAVAQRSLGGDWMLFVSIVQRMFHEDEDLITAPAHEPQATYREALAARLHKLRGSAGTVGATEVHRLSTDLEGLLQTPDSKVIDELQALSRALGTLRDAVTPWLTNAPASWTAGQQRNGVQPLTEAQREELMGLLRTRDLAALDRMDALKPALVFTMGVPDAERLFSQVQSLKFEEALRMLAAARPG